MSDSGREELARRLQRVFIADADTGQPVDLDKMREFADDILAADYTDPGWGARPGDGGPAARFVMTSERTERGAGR